MSKEKIKEFENFLDAYAIKYPANKVEPKKVLGYLYRYQIGVSPDEFNFNDNDVLIELVRFDITKKTPKGVWILSETKWVGNSTRKRYAHNTKEEALKSFLILKEKELEHIKLRKKIVERAILNISKITKGENNAKVLQTYS